MGLQQKVLDFVHERAVEAAEARFSFEHRVQMDGMYGVPESLGSFVLDNVLLGRQQLWEITEELLTPDGQTDNLMAARRARLGV